MNEVLEAIKKRRAIRNYKPEMLPKEVIEQIVEAGLYAASSNGWQKSIILAVTDKALRDELSEMNRLIAGKDEGHDPFYGAPVVLVVLGEKDGNPPCDGSLIMGNLMLAASSLNVGSCWVHRAKEEFESERGKEILKDLGITGDYEGAGHCILGYPNEAPEAAPRKENRVFFI